MENVLLLNGDLYSPIAVISWKKAVELIFSGKVKVIKETDKEIRSVSISIRMPSIVALKRYIHIKPKVKFTKYNVFARDNYVCQYCGKEIHYGSEITIDHVVPRSKGGISSWENCVTACRKCNFDKADRTLRDSGKKLLNDPKKPAYVEWITITLKKDRSHVPSVWREYYEAPENADATELT